MERLKENATEAELLEHVMTVLHDIGGSYYIRKRLQDDVLGISKHKLTSVLRKSLEAKTLTDEQIEKYALDTWEAVAMRLQEMRKEKTDGGKG